MYFMKDLCWCATGMIWVRVPSFPFFFRVVSTFSGALDHSRITGVLVLSCTVVMPYNILSS